MGKMIEFFKELLAPTVAAQAELAVLGVAPAEDMAIPVGVDKLSPAESAGIALRYALDEPRKGKPNDRSEADRAYAIAITDLQKVVAFFEMAVIQGDDGGLESMYDRLDAVLGESDDDAR